MSTSVFYNNIGASNEQGLLEDLIIESIQIYGIDFTYLPRNEIHIDKVFGQADVTSYTKAYEVEMYLTDYSGNGFQPQANFLSKFGLEIREETKLTVAKRVFMNAIGDDLDITRPLEGDLIYYPLNKKVFKITFVHDKTVHYPLGFLPTYDLFCELFEYADEVFQTGITEIDALNKAYSTNIFDHCILTDAGAPLLTDDGKIILQSDYNYDLLAELEDNIELDSRISGLVSFDETDPYGEVEH